ncbi:hypothetical protein KY289_015057 [Solanum tuberosum]|nr:hypothetical protein KY284_034771 [Solanum tuberosum]KAH0697575.1 hypothetical protein KY289_015057 [Solanum tuberosum]
MLLWAVDNPAPANYLLISGDGDFSNAIHQLRMRKYNILLAQPVYASPALAVAATNVWQWTSLAAGRSPPEFAFGTNTLRQNYIPTPIFKPISANQPAFSNLHANTNTNAIAFRAQSLSNPGCYSDTKTKAIYIPKNSNQLTMTSMSALCGVVMYNYLKIKDVQLPVDSVSDRRAKELKMEKKSSDLFDEKGLRMLVIKIILVDMLFWAADNPAPANYLLISGDRNFSDAIHQLRMRRYNILLAQPLKASPALAAAATNVWQWTSLAAGGSPRELAFVQRTTTVNSLKVSLLGILNPKAPLVRDNFVKLNSHQNNMQPPLQ